MKVRRYLVSCSEKVKGDENIAAAQNMNVCLGSKVCRQVLSVIVIARFSGYSIIPCYLANNALRILFLCSIIITKK